jgi:hypothetical protein
MIRRHRLIVLSILCLLSASYVYGPIGVGVTFGTVFLEKVSPGTLINIRQSRKLPYCIRNKSSVDMDVVTEIEQPPKEGCKEGYEPILDPTWLRVIPERVRIKIGETYCCDVVLTIPDDETLIGKHYQASIYTHTEDKGFFGAGVVNRFYFSIGTEGPEALRKAKEKKLLVGLNFDIYPAEIYMTVPAGEKIDVLRKFKRTIKLVNRGGTKLMVKMKSIENEQGFALPGDYEFTPDTSFISFAPEDYKVGKNRIKDTKMFIEIPDEEEHRNKKYMFVLKTVPIKPELPIGLYTRVYVTVQ